jgi:hypothetical protein
MNARRLLIPLGLGALVLACPGVAPGPVEQLCERYCQNQLAAVPTGGRTSCPLPRGYAERCASTCEKDLDMVRGACHTPLAQAYACGADNSWFCLPKEDGGITLTQFDTCRAYWDVVYACEQGGPDAGTP